ncbi:ABC transporter G family member 38-like [Selaginella moellendorffii]|nr:ABC transporter G family member 38-like [Selaginella moellendorffii]|eukprot:XP_024529740.1 ABC transporter G family member 38-like [Selaginella moellendorffii]
MPHPMSSSSSSQEQEESPPSPVDESAPRARSPEENAGPGFCPMCATRRSFGDVSHESPSTSKEKSPPWTLVLRFKAISVTMDHTEVGPGYDTFGKKLLGCLLGVCIKLARSKKKSSKIKVLKDVSGYVMPGSMTLVLGPPGSGKSTLLKVAW